MTVHVGQAGQQELATRVDALRPGRDTRPGLGTDPRNSIAIDHDRLPVNYPLPIHRDDGHALKRSRHQMSLTESRVSSAWSSATVRAALYPLAIPHGNISAG